MSHVKTDKLSARTPSGTITLGESGETLTIPSGVVLTNNGTASGFGGNNTPAFHVYRSSTQTLTDGANSKILFNAEEFDTDNAYDSTTNYRFTVPSGKAGKYFIGAEMTHESGSAYITDLKIYKNGSFAHGQGNYFSTYRVERRDVSISRVLDLSESDYIEIYVFATSSSTPQMKVDSSKTVSFFGFRLAD
jgi:hypothetical protein